MDYKNQVKPKNASVIALEGIAVENVFVEVLQLFFACSICLILHFVHDGDKNKADEKINISYFWLMEKSMWTAFLQSYSLFKIKILFSMLLFFSDNGDGKLLIQLGEFPSIY